MDFEVSEATDKHSHKLNFHSKMVDVSVHAPDLRDYKYIIVSTCARGVSVHEVRVTSTPK